LIWNRELWLIDHGASFLFHHTWENWESQAISPFAMIKDHVLLPKASLLPKVAEEMKSLITPEMISEVVLQVPDEWLLASRDVETAEEARLVYVAFLTKRLENSHVFVNHAEDARKALV
jgi:hypothetical protein